MALALDGTPASGQFSRTDSQVVALTTTASDDVIVVIVANETDGGTVEPVSTIADVAGLSWTLHKQFQWTPTIGNSVKQDLEIWWAHAPSPLTADNITVTLAAGTDDGCIVAFAVSGANFTSPFDTDASIPATASNVTGSNTTREVTGISTATADTFMFAAMANAQGQSESAPPSGFTTIANVNNGAGHVQEYLSTDYIINSSAQSGITVTAGGTGNNWGMVVSAIRIASNPEVDAAATPGLGFDAAASIDFEKDTAASPAMGFAMDATVDNATAQVVASVDMGLSEAAGVAVERPVAASMGIGFSEAAALVAQRELTAALSLGFVQSVRAGSKRRQPVVVVVS